MSKASFCLVGDDQEFSSLLKKFLEPYGRVQRFVFSQNAIEHLNSHTPHIFFVDLDLLGVDVSLEIIKYSVSKNINTIVISSSEDESIIKECLLSGVSDYYIKSGEEHIFQDILQKYQDVCFPTQINIPRLTFEPLFKKNLDLIFLNASNDFSTLLHGSTGSGKTYLARQIYLYGGFKGPFVSLNCSSIPEALFESEMFGHKKGAFSGAVSDVKGKIKEADNGVLYLDEIDSIPYEQQAKLLKVLEDKEFYPIGSQQLVKSNFKLICSSGRNLMDLVSKKVFREDLYYRISCLNLKLMPLKDRPCDIIPFLKKFTSGPRRFLFDDDAKELIENYSWPGNIRELQTFAKNLQLMQTSHITKTLIGKHFKSQSPKNLMSLTNEQREVYEEMGGDRFIEMMKIELVEIEAQKTHDIVQACKNLGVSTSSYYQWSQREKLASLH